MRSLKVNLGQKMRIKVNGTRIFPPFKLENLLDIRKTDEGVSVETGIGINLFWDGNSFLQVQAATSYKKKLCGLCGNYNNMFRDDLTSRRGVNYSDDEVWRFANSWKVGGIKACSRKHENLAKTPSCRLRKGWQLCKPLKDLETFDDCGSHLNPFHYFEACRKDMCECPQGKCYCDNFAVYAHECKRVGVHMTDHWKHLTGCETRNLTTTTITSEITQTSRRERKRKQRLHGWQQQQQEQMDFLTKHVPRTFLIQSRVSHRTPPPIH